jgi:outer membrane protein assembly factor BamA
VFIRPVPSGTGKKNRKDILIELKENDASEFNFMIGYGSEDKIRTQIEVNTKNLKGSARKIGLGLKASFIKRAISGSFTEPRLFNTRWRVDINSGFEYLEQPGFNVGRFSTIFSIGRSLKKSLLMNLSFRYEDAQLRHVEVIDKIANFNPRVRSMILSLSYDIRDNLFDPRTGIYLNWSNEMTGAFLRGNNAFYKIIFTGKYFYELNNNTILASSLEIGVAGHLGEYEEIPLSERFYAGGTNSLRGFEYQKVGPLDADCNPLGGELKLVWNVLEIRRSIYKILGGIIFVDIGNVWSRPTLFKMSDLRMSTGPGLRLSTPIGILRLDVGFNVNKRKDEPLYLLHFNMGHTF